MSTQTQHPARATWRTVVQTVISTVLTLGVVLPLVVQAVDEEFAAHLPDGWVAWLYGAAALATAVAATLARIMAIPSVDEALRRLGLSSAPTTYPVARYSTGDQVELVNGNTVTIDTILMSPGAEIASYQYKYPDGSPGLVHESEVTRLVRRRP